MQAIVLVGGEGTRLRPLTYGTPKPMVPIMNVPFLELTLLRLKDAGIQHAILPAGYMPEAITEHFGDGSRIGMRLTFVIEDEPLGTAGAIKNVEQHVSGPFVVLNGDVLTSLDLPAMLAYHKSKGGIGTLHLIQVDDPSAFGCVMHDASGKISAFVEKPSKAEAPTDEVNAGTYILERDVFQYIPVGRNVSIERDTFPLIIRGAARPLYAYTTEDYWIDMGRPEHYLAAHRHILRGEISVKLDSAAGKFYGAGTHANGIEGPVYIGNGVVIEAGARVGPFTVLGSGCTIEADALVTRSVLWDSVRVGSRAYVHEAIAGSRATIGAHARVGAGTVIAHDYHIEEGRDVAPDSRLGMEGLAESK